MRNRNLLVAVVTVVTLGLLVGCGALAAPTTAVPAEDATLAPVVDIDQVVAEAVLEPAHWSELSFEMAGNVSELLVEEGDAVSEGDVLARLQVVDLERAVSRAELDLRQAQLRLELLQEPVDEADIRQAEHAVEQAADALKVARMDVATIRNSVLLNETLEDAEKVFEDRVHRYEVSLARYHSGEEPDYWFVDQAQQRLDDARLNLDRIRQQGSVQLQDAANGTRRAQQSYDEAQDALQLLLKGPNSKDLEAARLDIGMAELALEEARSKLEQAVIRAPFAGVVTRVLYEPGEAVTPGVAVFALATLDQLQARTIDLTELDVARLAEGQVAFITLDALPELELTGHVTRISLEAVDYRGDVTYPVFVDLDRASPDLRWGMTAVVTIEPN
jgi:HlyD family secretion protein